ncbi:MAG: GNAT family N-acetyltransferase [Dehalococcoidia bacterium]
MASIRDATEDDLPRIVELLAQLSLEEPREDLGPPLPETYRTAFREVLADAKQRQLVLEDGGRIVGLTTLIIVPNLSHQGRPWAQVENVVVDEEQRSSGFGEQLMRHTIDLARDAGCYKLVLTSNKERAGAHRFYSRIGFRATHEGFRFGL